MDRIHTFALCLCYVLDRMGIHIRVNMGPLVEQVAYEQGLEKVYTRNKKGTNDKKK